MEFLRLKAGDDDDGRRLDKVALRLLPEKKAGDVFKSIRKGIIKVNDKKETCGFRIKSGDEIEIAEFLASHFDRLSDHPTRVGEPVEPPVPVEPDFNLEVIFKNENFLIINKPYDIATQGGNKNAPSLDEIARKKYPATSSLSFSVGPLHRLDKKTTGILAFSQSLSGAKWFSECIKNHEIKKTYLGIAEGKIEKKETWTDEIEGKEAITIATPKKHGTFQGKSVTLVEYEILTGRKHQIRLHSSIHGHPLFGDAAHGSKISTDGGFFLHALKMKVPQNNLALPEIIEAPPPQRFERFIDECHLGISLVF